MSPVTSNSPMERTNNNDEAKKKQESESHSDLDSHPQHLSSMKIAFLNSYSNFNATLNYSLFFVIDLLI